MVDTGPRSQFTKCIPSLPRETAQSYLGRLTSYFCYADPKEFCRDFALDHRGIQYGQVEALHDLARITGSDHQALVASTPRWLSSFFFELWGETFHTRVNPRHHIRLCPLCAREDLARNPGLPLDQAVYIRGDWTIGIADTCVIHRVKLATHITRISTTEKLDVGYECGPLLEELQSLPVEAADLDGFQEYVFVRVGAVPPASYELLDGLSLTTVSQLCYAFGSDLLRCRDRRGIYSDAERRAAGFEILSAGASGIDQAISEMRVAISPGQLGTQIVPKAFTYLHEAMSNGKQLGKLPDILVDTLFRLLPYRPGMSLLGRVCERVSVYTFKEAYTAYNLNRAHLRAFIAGTPGLGVKVGKKEDLFLVDRVIADRLFSDRGPFVTSIEFARSVGLYRAFTRPVLSHLEEAGIATPERGADTGTRPPFYSLPHAIKSVEDFLGRFLPVDPAGPGMMTVPLVVIALSIHAREFWKILASGKVKSIGLIKDQGLIGGIRVNFKEILSAVTGFRDPVTLREAAELIHATPSNVLALAQHKVLPTRQFSNRTIFVFERSDLEDFRSTYASLAEVRKSGIGNATVEKLESRGLRPTIDLKLSYESAKRTVFYRREDIAS